MPNQTPHLSAEAILTPAVVEAPSVSGVDAELANFLLAA